MKRNRTEHSSIDNPLPGGATWCRHGEKYIITVKNSILFYSSIDNPLLKVICWSHVQEYHCPMQLPLQLSGNLACSSVLYVECFLCFVYLIETFTEGIHLCQRQEHFFGATCGLSANGAFKCTYKRLKVAALCHQMGKHGSSWNGSTYRTVLPHLKQYWYAGK